MKQHKYPKYTDMMSMIFCLTLPTSSKINSEFLALVSIAYFTINQNCI